MQESFSEAPARDVNDWNGFRLKHGQESWNPANTLTTWSYRLLASVSVKDKHIVVMIHCSITLLKPVPDFLLSLWTDWHITLS